MLTLRDDFGELGQLMAWSFANVVDGTLQYTVELDYISALMLTRRSSGYHPHCRDLSATFGKTARPSSAVVPAD